MSTSPPPPGYPEVERRRRPRGAMSRLLTAPMPSAAIGARLARRMTRRRGWVLVAVAALGGAAWFGWASRVPVLTPRHRPEALWFALAEARYTPPLTVEPNAAVVRGRFSAHTPAGVAVREVMRLAEDMVIHEDVRRVGDYGVSVLWLRLPGGRGHWLVVAWMEGADLEVSSFRFPGDEADLTRDERVWGERLLVLALTPENFRAGALPDLHLRGEPPRSFGPEEN